MRRILLHLLVLGTLFSDVANLHAQRPTEYQVKAAFLFNFARFVTWPAESFEREEEPLVIGILGVDPFGERLDGIILNKKVGGRSLVAKRFGSMAKAELCHILFVFPSEAPQLPAILDQFEGEAVLIVGESPGFCEAGGMINLVLHANKVRFEINLESTEQAGLKLSSQLLKLASAIHGAKNGEAK